MSDEARVSRHEVVRLARLWIGTPYHHQASCRGAGTDCIGLVRGIWRDLYGFEPEPVPGYSRDWAEATGTETLLAAAYRNALAVSARAARPGDILVFRFRPTMVAKHAGVLASPSTFIHAVEGAPVAEVALNGWWRRRVAGAFAFPGIID